MVCSAGFVASTLLFVLTSDNWWPLYLSLPVLAFVCGYSFTKLGAGKGAVLLAEWLTREGYVERAA